MSIQCQQKVELIDTYVYNLYQQIGLELSEELSVLEQLTDLIQIFKDNNLIALREIYEKNRKIGQ